jgi:hypothetical protein
MARVGNILFTASIALAVGFLWLSYDDQWEIRSLAYIIAAIIVAIGLALRHLIANA